MTGARVSAGKLLVATAAALFLVAITLGGRGLGRRPWASAAGPVGVGAPPEARAPLAWTTLDARIESVYVLPRHLLRFKVALPPPDGARPDRPPARARVRFAAPLDGAKVDAYAGTPAQVITLLDGQRVGGDSVELALPPLAVRELDVTVHHHLRPVPVVVEVSVGRPGPR